MILRGEPQQYRVLVLITDSASPAVLLPPAIKAVKEREGHIILLHIVPIPEQLPYSAGVRYAEKILPLIRNAAGAVDAQDIPVKVSVQISHHVGRTIIDIVAEEHINLMILECCGCGRFPFETVDKSLGRVMNALRCETLILQKYFAPPFRNLLLVLEDPGLTVSALHNAWLLAEGEDSTIDLLNIFPRSANTGVREKLILTIRESIARFEQEKGKCAPRIILNTIDASKAIAGIVNAAGKFNCVVFTSASDSWLKRKLFRRKITQIARRIEPPLILVHSIQ